VHESDVSARRNKAGKVRWLMANAPFRYAAGWLIADKRQMANSQNPFTGDTNVHKY